MIEAVVSMFVLLLCVLIYSASFPVANQSRAKTEQANIALSLAQRKIETIRSSGFANATPAQWLSTSLIQSTAPVDLNSALSYSRMTGQSYEFTTTENAVFDSPATTLHNGRGYISMDQVQPNQKDIHVIVFWQDRDVLRFVRLSTTLINL